MPNKEESVEEVKLLNLDEVRRDFSIFKTYHNPGSLLGEMVNSSVNTLSDIDYKEEGDLGDLKQRWAGLISDTVSFVSDRTDPREFLSYYGELSVGQEEVFGDIVGLMIHALNLRIKRNLEEGIECADEETAIKVVDVINELSVLSDNSRSDNGIPFDKALAAIEDEQVAWMVNVISTAIKMFLEEDGLDILFLEIPKLFRVS